MRNIPLLILDLLLLPITLFRVTLIFLWGSKYNLKGFRFLDVIMHADNSYFNQEDCRLVNTIGTDYRVVIRDDSRIYPMDLNNYFQSNKLQSNQIVVGTTMQEKSKWDITTDEISDSDISEDSNNSNKISYLSTDDNTHNNNPDNGNNKDNDISIVDSAMKELYSAFEDK